MINFVLGGVEDVAALGLRVMLKNLNEPQCPILLHLTSECRSE